MASQEYGDYGPLLFTVASEQPPDVRTPRPVHSPLRESGTHSSARRSATPPGSIHMDTTPPQPPPIARLQDTFMADVEPTAGGPSPGGAGPSHAADQPAAAAAAQAGASGSFARAEQQGHGEDSSWVTVYGFTPDDLPLVLQEFQRCGDILQWGTFGSSPACNFTHIQYQNKYGAQRALMMSGRQLNSSLIIGVKQLEPQHRALVQAAGGDGSPGPRIRAAAGPARPYRVELPAAQVLPRRATWHQKVSEYIFGM